MNKNIEVNFKGKSLKGILINEDESYLTIKLSSGYNANIKKSDVKIISQNEIKVVDKKIAKLEVDKNLPKISILHTGGTIASKVDYATGAVSSKFTPEELLLQYLELNEIANISTKMIGNLMSEDLRFEHYNLILKAIDEEIKKGCGGIIISHGTDTMHYTSAALQYACKNLAIPVLLVGAQRSSDRASSDAFGNLNAAVDFIINNLKKDKKYLRVGVCMHKTINDDNEFLILDGINVKKMHSSRRNAFKQINYLPFAEVKNGKVKVLREDLLSFLSENKFSYTEYNTSIKIGFFKAHPNLFPEEIDALKIYDGVVIEGTGLGHLAVSEFDEYTKINLKNLNAVKNLIKKTKIVIGVQTVYGQTNMNIYSSGRYLLETGVLGQGMNLIAESLFCRMAYCLSQKEKKFEEIWNENLEGFDCRNIDIEEE
ncbi:MAG: Glu-tRNA(Gln) amidotransferase subunit GatD [Nanoarchaeota archaeon]|nr:Glu-tRNA(Gln) amidotransferase subunit GatD [Nanoarchaeota archaeon]